MRNLARLNLAAACLGCALAAIGQTWEKPIGPGLSYRMEVSAEIPRVLHGLKVIRGAPGVQLAAECAGPTIFDTSETKGCRPLSRIVAEKGAFGGINGDFFPFTGDPLGAMILQGELISRPFKGRPVFGWGPESSEVGVLTWSAKFSSDGRTAHGIDGLNESCAGDMIVLNTPIAGIAQAKGNAVFAVVRMQEPLWKPTSANIGVVEVLNGEAQTLPVEPGQAVLVGTGTGAAKVAKLKPGDQIRITMTTQGIDLNKCEDAIGGGPYLLREGQIFIDWKTADFKDVFASKRHPRTACGRTTDGDIWFVTVDGRQDMSAGATLDEMARIMARLGCVDAINLDGGGSTTLNLFNQTVNRPSGGMERPISNAILFRAPLPPPDGDQMVIQGQMRVGMSSPTSTYTVIGSDGQPIPNREVIWYCSGSAWMDQGGTLRAIAAGEATVTAFVRGKRITIPVVVDPI